MERGVRYYLAQQVPFTLHCGGETDTSVALLSQVCSTAVAVHRIDDGAEQKELTDKLHEALGGNLCDLYFVLEASPNDSGDGKRDTEFRFLFHRHGAALKDVLGNTALLQVEMFQLMYRDRDAGELEQMPGFTTQGMSVGLVETDGDTHLRFIDCTYNAAIDDLLGVGRRGQIHGKLNVILMEKDQSECCNTSAVNKRMLEEEIAPDAVIVASSGAEVKCHRGMLAAQSDVFRVMFGTDMQEAKTRRVEILDMDEGVVRAFLAYLYHGDLSKAEESSAVALELLKAAHKYNVGILEKAVRELLMSKHETWYKLEVTLNVFLFIHNFVEAEWEPLKKKVVLMMKKKIPSLTNSPTVMQFFRKDPEAALDFYQFSFASNFSGKP